MSSQSDDSIFLEYSRNLYASNDLDTMFSHLEKAVVELGFDNISYTYIPEVISAYLAGLSPVFKVSSEFDLSFIEHYAQENFGEHDFVIKRILAGDMSPMIWWQEKANSRLNNKEAKVIQIARSDYGIEQAVSIPTYTDGKNIAGVSITSGESEMVFRILCKEKLGLLQQMSFMFNDRVMLTPELQQFFNSPLLHSLSETEKKVLMGLSRGEPLKIISSDLGLDYKYISNKVMKTLKLKLKAKTRDHLLYKAGELRVGKK